LSAALLGSSVGLGLGVIYLNAGLARESVDQAEAVRMADAAGRTYTGSYLETQGEGLRTALSHYSFPARVEAMIKQKKFIAAAKARHRADVECLTEAVYYEARSESARGQVAVAQVVMNRVKHPAFPKTVCGVVFQGSSHPGCQFSFTCDGSMRRHREAGAWAEARTVATRVLAGRLVGPIGAATHYHTTAVSPFWAPQMLRVAQVGVHVFYKFSPYRMRAAAPGEPVIEQAVLTGAPAAAAGEIRVASPGVEKAIEASLQPAVTSEPAKPTAAKPADAAQLIPPQPVAAGS
jgi:spore germination cell wall hydrolase CwlJ-like protein